MPTLSSKDIAALKALLEGAKPAATFEAPPLLIERHYLATVIVKGTKLVLLSRKGLEAARAL